MISLIEHKSLKEINFLLKKSIKALKTSSNKECLTPSSKKDKIEQNSSTREKTISLKSRHNSIMIIVIILIILLNLLGKT